jgi:chromosome segregation ATPase
MVSAPVKDHDSSLNDAIQEFEKIFVDGIGRLKAAVSDDQAVVASEAQHAHEVIETLRANIAALEARLRDAEDIVHKQDLASQQMEESLRTEIGDLKSALKKKEEDLESRDSEISDFKSKADVLVEQVTRSELALQQAKRDGAIAAQNAEQFIEGLKANITVLEARLREMEDNVHKQDLASQKMEETLSAEIRDLRTVVNKKEEALRSRESEVNDFKSKIVVLGEQVTQLELAIEQAKGEAASEAQHAEEVIEDLKIKIARLQAQLNQTEQIFGGTDSTIKGLHHGRNSQATDLHAQLESQMNGTSGSEAEASVDIQAQANGVLAGEQSNTVEEQRTTLPFSATIVTSIGTEAARETVAQEALDRLITEFGELSNVMGSIASLIVRDHVRTLGESMEEFPQARLTKLLESLSREISDDKLKADFCERFAKL